MDVSVRKQICTEDENMLTSYSDSEGHIYDMKDTKERVMNIININGSEYVAEEGSLSRKEKTDGYSVTLHFSENQDDVVPEVQEVLINEFLRNLKQQN